MTVGSRSTNNVLGTSFPESVWLKNVSSLSSIGFELLLSIGLPFVLSWCSKQNNSQQELPIWIPACPQYNEMHSGFKHNKITFNIRQEQHIYSPFLSCFQPSLYKPMYDLFARSNFFLLQIVALIVIIGTDQIIITIL